MGCIGEFVGAVKAHKGKRALGKALSVSALNQMVSSGTNFALGIYLARTLVPAEFGLYGIGFAISLFYGGIGNALFLTQMVIHTPDKAPEDRLPYAARMLILVIAFCAVTAMVVALLLIASSAFVEPASHYAGFTGSVIAASVTYLLKEFFVRHAYNVSREIWALKIHIVIAFTMALLLRMQHQLNSASSVETALWIYAASHFMGAVSGYWFAKLPVVTQRRSTLLADLRDSLLGGKWASISNLAFFARTHAHTIVVASLLGPIGVAKLNAARLLVTPAIMFTPALSQVAMPRLVAARARGLGHAFQNGGLVTFVFLGVALVYSAILLAGYDLIVGKVLGANYSDLFFLTTLWCLWVCLAAIRNGFDLMGQVLRKFRSLSLVNVIASLLSLGGSYVFAVKYGLPGALIGLILSKALLILMLFRILTATTESQ